MAHINIEGAYGRKYNNLIDAQRDWNLNLDFRMINGSYISKSDYRKFGKGETIYIGLGAGLWSQIKTC